MYAYNTIGKRRPTGWAERRRYFKRLLARVDSPGTQTDKKSAT